jgi:hypothetical protein
MTVHFVTEINDVFGTEEVRFVTFDPEDAARASHLLRCQGLHAEIRDYDAGASFADFEAEFAA